MTVDTYKGESPGKKLARIKFWDHVIEQLAGRAGPIVVLASREMGDYSALAALGHGGRTIAVDRCPSAVEQGRSKFPNSDVRCGDVADIVRTIGEPIACAFLDFCAPICPETVATSRAVLRCLRPGAIFAVGLLKGREQDGGDLGHGGARAPLNRERRRVFAAMGIKDATRPMTARRALETVQNYSTGLEPSEEDDLLPTINRIVAFRELMHDPSRKVANGLRFINFLTYQSKTRASGGVPMMYAGFRVTKDAWPNGGLLYSEHCHSDEDALRSEALRLSSFADASLALNIDPRTVAAWKAHSSRGTYARQEVAA